MGKTFLLLAAPLTVLLAGCTHIDTPLEPHRVALHVTQLSLTSGEVELVALVDYVGAVGPVPATVEFLAGQAVLAQTSEREALPRTGQDPWDSRFRQRVVLQPGVDYNLIARIRWQFGVPEVGEKTLDSEVVKFRLTTP